MSRTPTLPRFLLGHNALIGVSHTDRSADVLKREFGDKDRVFLEQAVREGMRGIVLDTHPVALGAAEFLGRNHPEVMIIPMVPYAQGVVDQASRGGMGSMVKEMAGSGLTRGAGVFARTFRDLLLGRLPAAGSRLAVLKYLAGFPGSPPVCFVHNIVTDLLLGWGADDALAGFARAVRERGALPGFVTLNGGSLPRLAEIAGDDSWFMCAVNSRGIQMSPSREAVEEVLRQERFNVVAMSVLGGGLLRAEEEIPRALSFPAVKSLIIGSTNADHVRSLLAIIRGLDR
jgi:hypothetical protein